MNNIVNVCISVTAALCLVMAYDFQDAAFNQYLALEHEDGYNSLYDNSFHPRNRRDEDAVNDDKCKRRHRRPALCCAENTFEERHDREKELYRTCFKEVIGVEKPEKHEHRRDPFSCEEAEKRKNDMMCVMQCVAQKKGLIDDEGNPKENEINNFLKETMDKEPWFESVREKLVNTCITEAKNSARNQSTCNPSGASLKHCLFREIQLSCPDDQIKDRRSCDRFQEKIRQGVTKFDPVPAHPGDNGD
uniref:Odorant binding protein n=1 Tax=Cylas formicarius TaxID=197179 RepID=A0A6B7ME09_CYLFO|nr:odorant binding protein [Cylas formicarius]